MTSKTSSVEEFSNEYARYIKDIDWHLANDVLHGGCFLHWIMLTKPKQVLEIGAGSGKTAVIVKRLIPGARVIATDISPNTCNQIKEFAKEANTDIEVSCCDGVRLPYGDKVFDVAYSAGVIEHLGYDSMLKCVKEHIRVATFAIIEVPLAHWFLSSKLTKLGDELMWTKTTWIRELSRLGILLEINLMGDHAEELCMIAVMTDQSNVQIQISASAVIKTHGGINERPDKQAEDLMAGS